MIKRGGYVQYWFDTGAMGVQPLYGIAIEAGPKVFRVLWESGATNKCRQEQVPACFKPLERTAVCENALRRIHEEMERRNIVLDADTVAQPVQIFLP